MVKYGLKMFLKSLLSRKIDFSYLKRTNAVDMLKDPLPIFIEQIQGLYVKYKRKEIYFILIIKRVKSTTTLF